MAVQSDSHHRRSRMSPSENLMSIFRDCSSDPTEAIRNRLRNMLNTFLHHRIDAENQRTYELAGRCCLSAGIWYYIILEEHAIQERRRLGITDISIILSNERYQRSLVACCLEMALKNNNLWCEFPLLLQILEVSPYHFGMVIELVLRFREKLRPRLFRHLAQVEEKVLGSLAWTSDSPLWEAIRANGGQLPACPQVFPPHKLGFGLDPSRPVLQPQGNQPGVVFQPIPANPNQHPEHRPPRSRSLAAFARKVYMFMTERLRHMCLTLDLSDELCCKIWTCFEHSLVHFTDLMKNRQLDQLLMCAIFIMAKVSNMDLTFRRIKEAYMSQPHASTSVFKNVLLSGGNRGNVQNGNNPPGQENVGSLIDFFNTVYPKEMSDFALQFAQPPGVLTPPWTPCPVQNTELPRRHRLSSSHNIYISLLNRETTPRMAPRLIYTFGSDNSQRLQDINNVVSGRVPSRRSRAAFLMNGTEGEEDDGPPVRRRRLDGQSALQRRLMDVANDRAAGRNGAPPPSGSQNNSH